MRLQPLPRPLRLCAVVFLLAAPLVRAADDLPFLSNLFGDHMVLQRDQPNRFWGWTQPDTSVALTLDGTTYQTTSGEDGRWQIAFTPPGVGGPYTIEIRGEGHDHVQLTDILVGDVWLCSGQSNMAVPVGFMDGADEVLATADNDAIRMFAVRGRAAYSPLPTAGGEWIVSTADSARRFSGIGYLLGQGLNRELGVPIGLVSAAVGGTAIECWISPTGLASFDEFSAKLAEMERLVAAGVENEYGSFLMHWLDDYDLGQDADPAWSAVELDDSDWTDVEVPTGFGKLGVGEDPGVIWIRRTFTLPYPLPEGEARLFLGQVDKMDSSYINGTWVGASSWVGNPRRHRVAADLLKPGENVVAIRIFKRTGAGGIPANEEGIPYLQLGDESKIDLAGTWKGKLSVHAAPPHPLPLDFENYPTAPIVEYQGFIAPLAGLAIKGAIWYQGEANQEYPDSYYDLLPALMADWREHFGQGDFPFLVIGLPQFMGRSDEAGFSNGWTKIRDAQWNATQHTRRSGFVNATDTGDQNDIHPRDKQPVGARAVSAALAVAYGYDVVWQGPTLSGYDVEGSSVRLHFDHTDGGLHLREEGRDQAFAVAGADRQWHWAKPLIDGDTIVLRSPTVPHPVAVRYAWQSSPHTPLSNGAGQPAVPFRTDQW